MNDKLLMGGLQMSNAAKSEPRPKRGGAKILPLVIDDLRARAEMGRQKYGTYLEADNGRDALMDAYQESLDQPMYLRQLIEEQKTMGLFPVGCIINITVVMPGLFRIGYQWGGKKYVPGAGSYYDFDTALRKCWEKLLENHPMPDEEED